MQQFRFNLLIDFDLLINNGLSLDCWFILYCLTNNRGDLLTTYTSECSKIKTVHFETLVTKGFINLENKNNITLGTISLTEDGKKLIKIGQQENDNLFDECFQELKDTYPVKVPAENGTFRRLHSDLSRCKKLYRKILTSTDGIDQQMHKNILRAINTQVIEYTKGKQLPFMQNLSTYLHQNNFLQYFDVKEEKQVERGDDI